MAPQPMSQQCFLIWQRYDLDGLLAFIRRHGRLRVRVPVPRQRWPEPQV